VREDLIEPLDSATSECPVDPATSAWPAGPRRSGPLSGLRVLDLTRILAGPFATMHLADLGADVIKVESPERGDETRYWGPPFAADGVASYYYAVNHNKRAITLALDHPSAAAVAHRLAAAADVVVDNFLPGRMRRFGLDRETLEKVNPGVVTCSISGFGTGNEYSNRPGFDFLAQAMGGLMSVTGQPGGEPTRVGVAITDLVCGLYANSGILAALQERTRTGAGRHVEVSLLDSQVSILVNLASGWLMAGKEPQLFGNAHPSIAPYETLSTADGQLAVAVGTDRQFQRLAEGLDAPELAVDPRFVSNADRVANRAALRIELESRLRRHGRAYWLAHLVGVGVPVAPVNTLPEVFADPVVRERMLVEVDDVLQVRSPIRLDGNALPVQTPPPRLGQHTDDVLLRTGLSEEQIRAMRTSGAV
jgi:crotonobetainyl-CoA:carnitine CoA-transferase CaiB-like acyl-CoA transferase